MKTSNREVSEKIWLKCQDWVELQREQPSMKAITRKFVWPKTHTCGGKKLQHKMILELWLFVVQAKWFLKGFFFSVTWEIKFDWWSGKVSVERRRMRLWNESPYALECHRRRKTSQERHMWDVWLDEKFVSIQKRNNSLEGPQKEETIELSILWLRYNLKWKCWDERSKGEGWFGRQLQQGIFNKRRERWKKGVLNKLVGSRVKLDGGPTEERFAFQRGY